MNRNIKAECQNCIYWIYHKKRDIGITPVTYGKCKRFPPSRREPRVDIGTWLSTQATDTCGDHPDFISVFPQETR